RSGQADVTYDVTITKPDGSQQSAAKDLVAHRGKALDPKLVSHPEQLLNLAFSAQDIPGTYRIAATVKDHVANLQVTVSQDVLLLPGNSPVALPAGFDANQSAEWLSHYYLNPQPRMLLPVLQWISKDTKTYSNPNAWPPVLGLCEMILRDNPWVVPTFVSRLTNAGTPTPERATVLYVLAYVYRDDENFGLQLPESDREYFQLARHQHWPDPSSGITEGGQLDTLWGRFFATGAYAPIQALVAVLDYHVYHGKIDEFKKLSIKPAQAPVEVYKEIVFNAALWSLKSNAKQHRLVHDYCAQMLKNYKGTDNDVRVMLAIIVEATVRTPDGRDIDLSQPPGK
ncbi:MAG: hypothetical protein JWM35_1933, partial [Verrucomicrobia bacterium]|nr:hypothetical protein [Verrucomicrobiota bacterium]